MHFSYNPSQYNTTNNRMEAFKASGDPLNPSDFLSSIVKAFKIMASAGERCREGLGNVRVMGRNGMTLDQAERMKFVDCREASHASDPAYAEQMETFHRRLIRGHRAV